MGRSHAQLFANQVLPRAVFANGLEFTKAIAIGDTATLFVPLWEQAGAELAPLHRAPNTGFTATVERRGLYTIAIITPPPPRESGDPAAIAIIGRGDGITKLSTIAYYVLELHLDATLGPRFTIVSRTGLDERGMICGEGPFPDHRWLKQHAFELYAGRTPAAHVGVPELPVWYWWFTFDGAAAIRTFGEAHDTVDRFEAVRKAPMLLLPEIADAAEIYIGGPAARTLRDLRPHLRRETSLATTWTTAAQRLANTVAGNPAANATRAVPLIAEAVQYGALTRAQGYELEASVRARLAALGVETQQNYLLSEQLFAAARNAEQARLARGSVAPPINTEDPVWKPLFLDEGEISRDHSRAESDEAFSAMDPMFLSHGGLRAGYAAWASDEYSAMARVIDARWVFRTSSAAVYFMRATMAGMSDGLPMLPTPALGDDVVAFGGEIVGSDNMVRRSHVIIVRVGRVVARLQATEGAYAAACRNILHAQMLQPIAHKIVQRAHRGLAAYWLAVVYPTNAVPALVHSPGHDAARLLQKYPLLGLGDLPAAIATMGDQYGPVARSLASFQAQVRAHRWQTYRESMLALARSLLTTDMGDPRVNAAHAHEIVSELRYLDPDPIWLQLDAECRARA